MVGYGIIRAIKNNFWHKQEKENGKYNPSLDLAFIIADFFGKTIEEIFIYRGRE